MGGAGNANGIAGSEFETRIWVNFLFFFTFPKKNPDPSLKLGSGYKRKSEERGGQFAISIYFIY
jgi:hypothetical protein